MSSQCRTAPVACWSKPWMTMEAAGPLLFLTRGIMDYGEDIPPLVNACETLTFQDGTFGKPLNILNSLALVFTCDIKTLTALLKA